MVLACERHCSTTCILGLGKRHFMKRRTSQHEKVVRYRATIGVLYSESMTDSYNKSPFKIEIRV